MSSERITPSVDDTARLLWVWQNGWDRLDHAAIYREALATMEKHGRKVLSLNCDVLPAVRKAIDVQRQSGS